MVEYWLMTKILREVGITILIAIAIFALFRVTLQGYTVRYSCMLPNIEDGEWIMVSKAKYFFSDPQRGDVIVFDPRNGSQFPYIKRVIGLPGDTVEVKDGKVFVNGIPLEEEYIMAAPHYIVPAKKIPDGEYFVLGDNRNNSNDSHIWGTIHRDDIIGKAWLVYWPPSKWGPVNHYTYPELGEAGEQEAMSLGVVGGVA
jgi:signal peptidase I, bacterial type